MFWTDGVRIVRLMTVYAVFMQSGKLAVHMALFARHGLMSSREIKSSGTVTERGRGPDGRGVTLRACMGKTAGHMIWRSRPLVIRLMTCITVGIGQLIIIIDMT